MLMTEFDINVAKEVWMEEAREEGDARRALITARNLLMRGHSLEEAAEITDYPVETLKEQLGIAD
jgi:hypothetical protein